MVFCVDGGQEDAHGVRGGEEVDEEEVVAVAGEGWGRADQQGDGRLLRLLELRGWVGDFPRVPVLQQDGFEVRRAEDVGEVVAAGGVEDVGEALVGGEAREDLERLAGAVG